MPFRTVCVAAVRSERSNAMGSALFAPRRQHDEDEQAASVAGG